MATTTSNPAQKKASGKARQCRFIVRSAEEAVRRIRETLGPEARVVSVKQVKGEGLQRFLSAPRLEVIARLDPPAPPEPVPEAAPEPESEPAALEVTPNPRPPASPRDPVAQANATADRLRCGPFLEKAGLPPRLLGRLESDADWRAICDKEIRDGLPLVVRRLREVIKAKKAPQLPPTAAFLGGPGTGKTTALCKLLARDVFLNGLRPQVLRLEIDKPHLDDGLVLYCDVLGITCTRSADEIDFGPEATVYVDIPGYSMTHTVEQDRIRKALDELRIDARILVLNAAYESEILNRFMQTGQRLGARYQILTHLDELDAVGKLWSYLFDTERHLLFFSNGQNIASDRIDDPFGFLIERTFPR